MSDERTGVDRVLDWVVPVRLSGKRMSVEVERGVNIMLSLILLATIPYHAISKTLDVLPPDATDSVVWTDQPALQFYGGNFFDGTTCGKYGKTLNYRESIALETQKYPDTPHNAHFPSTLLNPGEKYTHSCVYNFSVK